MPFEYKCQSCQAIGDLDSFVDQIECPNCGGVMFPSGGPTPLPTQTAAADGDAPTTIVPRGEILKEMAATAEQPRKVVKVAKIVNIGFGGMLTTSATRGFKPITPGRKDAGFPFSQQSSFPQQTPPAAKEASSKQDENPPPKQDSSSANMSAQKKKTFTVSKSKAAGSVMLQTSTQQMDATQIDPRIAEADRQLSSMKKTVPTAPPVIPVQLPQENPHGPEEIQPKPRIAGPTSTSLKFLPKGALKVAQTHTSIQRSQIPPPPSKLQSHPQSPLKPQRHTPNQQEPQYQVPVQDEDFMEQVRIEAERQEAIIREAYRIAEEKLRKEREEIEKKAAEKKESVLIEKNTVKAELAAQIAKELAETDELIRKERETLELRKKELQEIRRKAEEEIIRTKQVQDRKNTGQKVEKPENDTKSPDSPVPPPAEMKTENVKTHDTEKKLILLSPQKPVKLKSTEGSEILMRSSKNLQIDKNMLETGKQALKIEELEKKDSRPEMTVESKKDDSTAKKSTLKGIPPATPIVKKGLQTPLFATDTSSKHFADKELENGKSATPGIVKPPLKEKTDTKVGINTDASSMTNSALVKIQNRKKTVILIIVAVVVFIVCLLIFFVGGKIVRMIKSSLSPAPAPPSVTAPAIIQNGANKPATLEAEYKTVYKKIKPAPATRQEIDANIKELQDFIDNHPGASETDRYIMDAKSHIKDMQNLKELYNK